MATNTKEREEVSPEARALLTMAQGLRELEAARKELYGLLLETVDQLVELDGHISDVKSDVNKLTKKLFG